MLTSTFLLAGLFTVILMVFLKFVRIQSYSRELEMSSEVERLRMRHEVERLMSKLESLPNVPETVTEKTPEPKQKQYEAYGWMEK